MNMTHESKSTFVDGARLWLVLAHASALLWLVIPFGHVCGPAAVRLLAIRQNANIQQQAQEALNFQLWGAVLLIVSYVLFVLICGFVIPSLVAIALMAISLFAAARAAAEKSFRYPFVPKSKRAPLVAALIIVTLFAATYVGARIVDAGEVKFRREWRPAPTEAFDPIQKVGDTDWLQYAELSRFVYAPDAKCAKCNPPQEYEGGWRWTSLYRVENEASGFYAQVFRYMDGTVVIAFRGTEPNDWKDVLADLAMGFGVKTRQFRDAEEAYLRTRAEFGPTVRMTGHSLGGSLAQYLGAKYASDYTGSGKWSVAFNGFGVARVAPELASTSSRVKDKVFNVTQSFDIVSSVSFPFTIVGIVTDAINFLRDEPQHHLGCKMSFPETREPWNALRWHSVDQMQNDVMLYEFGSTDSTQIRTCPPPRPMI